MEKQIEKFRQRLIAEGNAPEKVPRWAFDADGGLTISIPDLKCPDISELRGLPVTSFGSKSPSLHDLSPLAGAPLRMVGLGYPCGVSDLSPLRCAPLERLSIEHTPVADISMLRDMPLRGVFLEQTPVTDVSVLADIPTLEEVQLPPGAKNVEVLRKHPRIAFISYSVFMNTGRPTRTATEFWKEFDAKKAAAPK